MTQELLTENSALKQSLQPRVSDVERLGQRFNLVVIKASSLELDENRMLCSGWCDSRWQL
jgi:hypothetical protein